MAGFEDLIRGTLKKHGDTTPQSRASIYDSSRQALERMLSQNQSLDLTDQSLQRQRLEKAIADIEASYTTTATAAPPAPVAPTAPPAPPAPAAPIPAATAAPATPAPPVAAAPVPPAPVAEPDTPPAPSAVLPPEPIVSPPPIPVFKPESSAPPSADPGGRVEPGFDVPPIPVPPTAPSVAANPQAPAVASPSEAASRPSSPPPPPSPPAFQPNVEASAGNADAYSEAVEASEGNERKPYAKLLLWTIIVVGIGVALWWAVNFGPALLKQQLGGSVPNPGQTIESGQFVPGDGGGEGWVTAFNPADDSINIDTGGRGTAEVFQNANETFVRLASNAGGNDNNLKILIPRGVMLPLKGAAATVEVLMKSSAKASQEFAVYCEFGSMGSCGRKRFTASDRPDAVIFDVLLNNVELAADEDAYLTFNSDMGGEGRAIDIYGIRVRLNR